MNIGIEMLVNLPILIFLGYQVWIMATEIPKMQSKIEDNEQEIKRLRSRLHDLANQTMLTKSQIQIMQSKANEVNR